MTTASSSEIDELLERLTSAWQRLPAIASAFASWDDLERLDFILEWPLQDDDLEALNELVMTGQITTEQRHRFDALLSLIEHNRPVLDTLVNSRIENR